jgi:hypothetical protein
VAGKAVVVAVLGEHTAGGDEVGLAIGPLLAEILEGRELWEDQAFLFGLVDRDPALGESNLFTPAVIGHCG